MPKRNALIASLDVLRATYNATNVLEILTDTGLSFLVFRRIIDNLIKMGLTRNVNVEQVKQSRLLDDIGRKTIFYETTDKGREFLSLIEGIEKRLKISLRDF